MFRYLCIAAAIFTVAYGKKKIQPTKIESYPYQVSIAYAGGVVHACSGAIISPEWIVTAARCVSNRRGDKPIVRAGSDYTGRGGSLHGVTYVKIHEFYEKITKDFAVNDVALLRIEPPLRIDKTRQAVQLFNSNATVVQNSRSSVTGWGYRASTTSATEGLKVTKVPVINKRDCSDLYVHKLNIHLDKGQVCAGRYETASKSVCDGDAGGPMVIRKQLAGIVSFAYKCGEHWAPTIYTEVARYRDWIKSNSGI